MNVSHARRFQPRIKRLFYILRTQSSPSSEFSPYWQTCLIDKFQRSRPSRWVIAGGVSCNPANIGKWESHATCWTSGTLRSAKVRRALVTRIETSTINICVHGRSMKRDRRISLFPCKHGACTPSASAHTRTLIIDANDT